MVARRELFGAVVTPLPIASTVQPRGADRRLVRLATLDLESRQDFTRGFRMLQNRRLRAASFFALDRALEREGLDAASPITIDRLRALIAHDPIANIASKTWLDNQNYTWKTLQEHFHSRADEYLTELEAADRLGPGALDIPADFIVPDYARHEIHVQPGGYVGDPFAGHLYHYGTNSFYVATSLGNNDQDEAHKSAAARLPIPVDGKVKHILDMGCGIGQLSVALKERFPDAEVWGVDVGAPMVRYAHMRANRLRVGANFAQRLAEDTRFPDGHFDLVTSYLLHHEVPAEITRRIINEAQRVTRPGGVYYPLDFISGGSVSPPRTMHARWWDHRWNNERWSLEYHSLDFTREIAQRGFSMVKNAEAVIRGYGIRHGVRA